MTRRATLADAPALAAVQLRAMQRDYADIVPSEVLADQDLASVEAEMTRILSTRGVEAVAFALDGEVVGFAAVEPARVRELYVAPHAQGAGVGSALLAAAVERLRAGGAPEATLEVLRDNGRARRFYEGQAWTLVAGADREDPWGPHVTYRRSLV